MTEIKKILPIAILVICLSGFIFAAQTITPSSFTIDEDTYNVYQIQINNTDTADDGNITAVNITLPSGFIFVDESNDTTSDGTFTNTSSVLSWVSGTLVNGGGERQNFSFNATMATAGSYNFTIVTVNSSTVTTSYLAVTINDTTFPSVSALNLPVISGNYSGNITLNATIVDDTESLVFFNITNSSGGQNGTFTASGTGNTWNATMDTSHYIDGLYNISVWVNDSNNQINNTIIATTVRIDNTNPTNNYFYCTPNEVYTGDTVTCYCTDAADSGSGVASTSFTSSPSTTTAGTFTETCTITDRAGNSIAPTTTYTVKASSGSSFASSGGGSSSSSTTTQTWKNTYTSTEEQLKTGYSRSLSANERVKVRVINEDHFVGIKSITATSATIEIASDPIEITLDVGEDAKADVDSDGTYDIYVMLKSIVDGKADITIMKVSEEVPEGEEPITTTGEFVEPEEEMSEESSTNWIWILVGLVVLGIIAGIVYKKKQLK